VLRADAFQVVSNFRKRFIPRDLFPTAFRATNRMPQPVFIEVNVLQSNGFRTDVPAAKRIILVATNVEMLSIPNSDLDAANRFAEITVTIMGRAFHETALNVSARNCFVPGGPVSSNATDSAPDSIVSVNVRNGQH